MPGSLKKSAVAAALAAALLLPLIPSATAAATTATPAAPIPAPGETDAGAGGGTLVERISEAAADGVPLTELSAAVGLADDGAASLEVEGGSLAVTVTFAQAPNSDQIAAVEAIGAVDRVFTIAPALAASVDPLRLSELEGIDGVTSVEVVLEPQSGDADTAALTEALGATTAAQTATASTTAGAATGEADAAAASCRAIPVEADGPLHTGTARERFGVDGTGITVGIISDSFDEDPAVTTTAAADVALGVLPGPGNPCGYETPVEVLADYAGGDDEGRAMAQLVHGIAPGARLMFATGTGGQLVMAQAISDLVAAGADVIVDDLSYSNEPSYQQGVISTQIVAARDRGVQYFTAAGNSTVIGAAGGPSEGRPVSGWSTPAYKGMACPDWVVSVSRWDSYECLDFNPDGAPDATDSFGYDGSSLAMTLEWGEPQYGVTSDFEPQFYYTGATTPVVIAVGSVYTYDNPMRVLRMPSVVPAGDYDLVVVRRLGGDATTPAVSLLPNGMDGMTWREHDRSSASVTVGTSVIGHAADGSAVAVAAVDVATPDQPEDFTAFGPGSLLFEPVDAWTQTPSPAYPEPIAVATPEIAGLDGLRTSFFGRPVDGADGTEYRFFGTSAAAPVMAAVHALAAEYTTRHAPAVSPDEIVETAMQTTTPLTNPYVDTPDADVFGAGLVNGVGLLAALPAPAVTGLAASATDAASVSAGWAPQPAASSFAVELLSGDSVVQRIERAAGVGTADFTGLSPATAYRVRVISITSGLKESGIATSAIVTTPALAPVVPVVPAADGSTQLAATGQPIAALPLAAGALAFLLGGALVVAQRERRRRAHR